MVKAGGKTKETECASLNEDWLSSRYAVDANGQAGVVPENHLEMIDQFTAPPPIPEHPVEPNPNDDFFGSNEQPVILRSEPSLYENMSPAVDWPTYEPGPVAAPFEQVSILFFRSPRGLHLASLS